MDLFLKSVFKDKKYKKFPLTEEGSDRRYVRIRTDDSSWILACSPIEQQEKFLQKHKDFSLAGLNVPKWTAQDSEKGFLLLEDLGDHNLEKEVLKGKEFPSFYYFQALDQIIKLQNPQSGLARRGFFSLSNYPFFKSIFFFLSNKKRSNFENLNNWSSFTPEDFFKEMLWTEEHLIRNFFHLEPDEKFRENYLKEWGFLCKELISFPFLASHRDYHSRNLFIKDKKIYLIDFQDAGFFPRFYDVVSLIYDVYVSSKMDNKMRERLLDYFLLKCFHEEKMTNEIRTEISITLIQRLFKACGSFASFYSLKQQKTHLPYIRPALGILRKQLHEIKQYPAFLSLIDFVFGEGRGRLLWRRGVTNEDKAASQSPLCGFLWGRGS